MVERSASPVLFPINQSEQARQANAEYLLAQDVYQKIANMLEHGLERVRAISESEDLDQNRAHEAILLQGARGTGKSAILVNLELHLKAKSAFASDLLILKPIDPTLLEDGDNLFLNIFIAALVRDKQVKTELDRGGSDAEAFYDQLNKLGTALEGSQTQREKQGIDKVRALIGSGSIADQVHKLFQCTLKLTGKKLIVLPIDDVDTALQHAYDKIEIVRKYLVSPCVIPIISGDLELYDDLISRNFHGRLLKRSDVESDLALLRAKQLSIDYQRKILPLPRRIDVPRLDEYLNDDNVKLSDASKQLMSFPVFKLWLEAILNERINGVENSFLPLPISSVREFAQLVSHLHPLLSKVGGMFDGGTDRSSYRLRRRVFMREDIANAIDVFAKDYASTRRHATKRGRETERERAYHTLQTSIKDLPPKATPNHTKSTVEWQDLLLTYFQHHQRGGAIFLALSANQYFRCCAENKADVPHSVFDTDLFLPRTHEKYHQFVQTADIQAEWENQLSMKIPNAWIKNLPRLSILPYPRPELGRRINSSKTPVKANGALTGNKVEDAELVRRLMTYYNFYTATNRATLTLTGRVLELLITSLIHDVSVDGILDLIYRAPFHSATAIANTKTFSFDGDDEPEIDIEDVAVGDTLSLWVDAINAWRRANEADLGSPPNAWLIYNVFNKYFNQVSYFNQESDLEQANRAKLEKRGTNSESNSLEVFGTAVQAFRAIWAIFGSFEKSQIFGFDEVIAYRNIGNAAADFEKNQLYLQNIKPFLQRSDNAQPSSSEYINFHTGAYTYLLASHPLKALLEGVYENMKSALPAARDELAPQGAAETSPQVTTRLSERDINVLLNPLLSAFVLTIGAVKDMPLEQLRGIVLHIEQELPGESAQVLQMARKLKKKSGGSALSKLNRVLIRIDQLESRPRDAATT